MLLETKRNRRDEEMMSALYPEETLDSYDDDGTMPASREALEESLIGRRIVRAEKGGERLEGYWNDAPDLTLILDNGKRVRLVGGDDCCAYTEVQDFLLNPNMVDHAITGVGTTDGYTSWHIFADKGDVMSLSVDWSCGNPFYYAYGFTIVVDEIDENGEAGNDD